MTDKRTNEMLHSGSGTRNRITLCITLACLLALGSPLLASRTSTDS